MRDFIDVKDAAKKLNYERTNKKFNIFNIGRGKNFIYVEVAKKLI